MSALRLMILSIVFLTGVHTAVATPPTPTPLWPPPPEPSPEGGTTSGQFISSPGNEPAITMFPYNGGQRAVVFANSNKFAVYDLVGDELVFVTQGNAPNPEGFVLIGDPVAVTQPNGTIIIGALAFRGTSAPGRTCAGTPCEGLVVVWHSTDGINWSDPITVVEYFQEFPPLRSFADKPWLDVSKVSGRLWMVWDGYAVSVEGPYCVVTSLDGVNWSDCQEPGPGQGVMSIAVDGPDSAVAIWDQNQIVKSSRCTASGLTVSCGPVTNIGPRIDVGGDVLQGIGIRAPALFTIAGDEISGNVLAVWGGQDQAAGQPIHSSVVWSENTGNGWTTPLPVTAPTSDQLLPEIAFWPVMDGWLLTLYQRVGSSTLFNIDVYRRPRTGGSWEFQTTLGQADASQTGFFGDYSWAECPNLCAVAWTSHTPASGSGNRIEVEVVNCSSTDTDEDGIGDPCDNCPNFANPSQVLRGGDPCPCSSDQDGDGIGDECDNCLDLSNPTQRDRNSDGVGDKCTCAGDCNGDENVFGSEISTAMGIWGDALPLANCPVADADADGQVMMDDVTKAVINLGEGCIQFDAEGGNPGQSGGEATTSGSGGGSSTQVGLIVWDAEALPGGYFDVPISLSGSVGDLTALQLDLEYDGLAFENLDPASNCTLDVSVPVTHTLTALAASNLPGGWKRVRLGVRDPNGVATLDDGPIATCTFRMLLTEGVGIIYGGRSQAVSSDVTVIPSTPGFGVMSVCSGCTCN